MNLSTSSTPPQRYADAEQKRDHASRLVRRLEEVRALDRDNAALFQKRLAVLQASVAAANAECPHRGTGTRSRPTATHSSPEHPQSNTPLETKERRVAELSLSAQAVEEGEQAVGQLLAAALDRLHTSAIPNLRRRAAEGMEMSTEALPPFPFPAPSTRGSGDEASSLDQQVTALSQSAAALDGYLTRSLAPLWQRRHVQWQQEADAARAALTAARRVRAVWQAKLASLLTPSGMREGEAAVNRQRQRELTELRAVCARLRQDAAWLARAAPLLASRDSLKAAVAEQQAAEAALSAEMAEKQRAAEALVEQQAAVEHLCEQRKAQHAHRVAAAEDHMRAQQAAARQAAAQEAECLALRQRVREQEARAAGLEAERLRAQLLLGRAELAVAAWRETDSLPLKEALRSARDAHAEREVRLQTLAERLAELKEEAATLCEEVASLRTRKRLAEQQITSRIM